MKPQSLTYQEIQKDLVENFKYNRSEFQNDYFYNLKTKHGRWNFINEAWNSKRMRRQIFSLKNSLGDDLLTY